MRTHPDEEANFVLYVKAKHEDDPDVGEPLETV